MIDCKSRAIDSSSSDEFRKLVDVRVVFLESAIERSSTEEEQERSNPDNVKAFNVVLAARDSRKAFVRLVEQ